MRISGWSSDVCSSDLSGDAEVMVRGGNTQFLEEDVRHVGVEMLPGVKHDLGNLVVARQGPADGCRLDELRAGANDGDRKSVVSGKSVSVRVDLGGSRQLTKKHTYKTKDESSNQ